MLKVKNLTKIYRNKTVVDNLSFNVEKGKIFGLLGPNGAGKTTTIRMILNIISKNNGEISLNDKPLNKDLIKSSYLPEDKGLYSKIKIYDQLKFFAELKGVPKNKINDIIHKLTKELEVEEYLNMMPEQISKGNKQKLQIVIAFINDPDIVFLDEPFSGLDPVNADLISNFINKYAKDKYVILSAHQMEVIEKFCHQVLILKNGKTLVNNSLNSLINSYASKQINIITDQNIDSYIKECNLKINTNLNNNYIVDFDNENNYSKLLKLLIENNINILKFEKYLPNLHEIFVEKVKGENNE